jgi:hypothetical protein
MPSARGCSRFLMPRLIRIIALLAASAAFAGCSDLKFVNVTNLSEGPDPREDMRLTEVIADLTSGGLVQRRVSSDSGIYSQNRNYLELQEANVETFNNDFQLEGMTAAKKAVVHLADKPELPTPRSRNDIEFAGNVVHRIPMKDDPTSDAIMLQTELLEWDQKGERFRCKSFYRMVMAQPGRSALVAIGDGFAATRDLRSWVVTHGGLTTRPDVDVRQEAAEKRAEIHSVLAMDASNAGEAPEAEPIELPSQREPGVVPQPIEIPGAPVSSEIVNGRVRYKLPQSAAPTATATPRPTPAEQKRAATSDVPARPRSSPSPRR